MKKALRKWVVQEHPEWLSIKLAAQEMLGVISYERTAPVDAATAAELNRILGNRIMTGPFAGMIYTEDAICSEKWPKLLGTYELELAELMEELLGKGFSRLIDVGCAEGYYAIGFARRCRNIRVLAIDPLREAGRRLRRLASANEVLDQIEFRRWVSIRALDSLVDDSTLIVMDCEGVEIGLLNPDKQKRLHLAEIVVEVHDFARPGMTEELTARFRRTHDHRVIEQQGRNPERYPCLASLDKKSQKKLLDERRPRNLRWLHLIPRGLARD